MENYSYKQDIYNLVFTVYADQSHSIERVEAILHNAIKSTMGVLSDPPPSITFTGTNKWSAEYCVSFWATDYSRKAAYLTNARRESLIHLQLANIQPATEQQRVYLHQSTEETKGEENKLFSLLKNIEIFKPFSDETKLLISQRAEVLRFDSSETVVKQGEVGDSLFVIEEGATSVFLKTDEQESFEVNRMGAGSFFGEMALLTGQERTSTVVATTKTIIHKIEKSDILPFIQQEPSILRELSEILTQRTIEDEKKLKQRIVVEAEKESIFKALSKKIYQFFGFGEETTT